MQISRFGIQLVRLSEEHIEMVRGWRNAPEIRDFMEYREHITAEMQSKWFHALDPVRDFYFLIYYNSEAVGLIHTSDIDWQKRTGHAGLFIRKSALLGSHVPVLASLTMVDFFFCFCGLKKIFAKVMQANPVAVKYNRSLGFMPSEDNAGKKFIEYFLTHDNYSKSTSRLHQLAETVGTADYEIKMENELIEQLKTVDAVNPSFPEKILKVLA